MSISLCSIVKNEEATIYNALSSSRAIVDEYIIGVDTLCTDNTMAEVMRFAASCRKDIVVYDMVWEKDFSKARNDCMQRATKDWIFILDGHEFLRGGFDKIKRYLDDPGSFEVFLVELHNTQRNRQTVFFQERFFRNLPEYRYHNACHNIIVTDPEKTAKLTDVVIEHHRDEILTDERQTQRAEMNIPEILERAAKGDRRAKAQLPQEYISLKRFDKAAEALEDYLQCEMDDAERYQVYIKLSMATYYSGKYQEVARCLTMAEEFNTDNRNAHLVFLGEFFYLMHNYEVATTYFKRALRIPKPRNFWFLYPRFYYEIPSKYLRQIYDNYNVESNREATAQPNG